MSRYQGFHTVSVKISKVFFMVYWNLDQLRVYTPYGMPMETSDSITVQWLQSRLLYSRPGKKRKVTLCIMLVKFFSVFLHCDTHLFLILLQNMQKQISNTRECVLMCVFLLFTTRCLCCVICAIHVWYFQWVCPVLVVSQSWCQSSWQVVTFTPTYITLQGQFGGK